MAYYVDGFVLPVPKKNRKKYIALARKAGKIWMKYGALQYVECIADDVQKGKSTSFPQSVKLKSSEIVYFSWIVYKSKKSRDQIVKKVMSDPAMNIDMSSEEMKIFDGRRMICGGFQPDVHLGQKYLK